MTEVLRGPDVSAYQGSDINWHAVKGAGASFAFCKATEGIGYVDPTFNRNWHGIKEAGLVRGAYAFLRADTSNNPEDEAAWFLRCLGTPETGDLIILDVEVGGQSVGRAALTWLRAVEHALGFPALLYTYLSFAQQNLQDPALAHYSLFLSLFDAPCPASVPPWQSVALHQWTDSAVYPGIPGPCDESVIARDLAGLLALGKPAAEKPSGGPSPVYRFATVTTDMWLRRLPRADSARLVNLPVGTVLPIYGAPTPNWANVRAPNGAVGWVLIANCTLSVEHP